MTSNLLTDIPRMKIVVLDTTAGGALIGGAQTFLPQLLSGLTDRGHDTHFVTRGRLNERIRPQITNSGANVHSDWIKPDELVEDVTPAFAEKLNRLRPDVFVVSVSGDIGWTVLPLLRPEIATLMIGHSDNETFYAPLRHYSQLITRAVGVSEEICRNYVDQCGIPPERVQWIPYGVAVKDEPPSNAGGKAVRLAFVGRVEESQKRASDLIGIAKRLSDTGVDYVFNVVGDGELIPSFRLQLSDQIANGVVNLRGWVAGDEVINVLRSSDIFLLTSDSEGFCIALTESMANGCCPIVTDIPSGNKQLVRDGETGYINSIGDIDAFVDRIKTLNNDRDLLARLRVAAWRTGREYGIERMVDNYVACFERAVEDARAKPRTPDPNFPLMPSCRSKYPLWLRRLKAKVVG